MAVDPVTSAADALAAHLGSSVDLSALPASFRTLDVRTAWPDWSEDADLQGVLVALTSGDPDEMACNPIPLGLSGDQTTWKVANLEWVVQVDLWVPYRAHLAPAMEALDQALDNLVPQSSGLQLTHDDYHGLPVHFEVDARRVDQDGDAAPRGAWRGRFTLRAQSSRVRLTTSNLINQLDATITATGGASGSETTTLVTAS